MPDPTGDLYFNGVASDTLRRLDSVGVQAECSYSMGFGHTLRGGFSVLDEIRRADVHDHRFSGDANGDPTGPVFPIIDRNRLRGLFAGGYLQDEWKVLPSVTLNWGARLDAFDASFDKEAQLSPRINLIDKISDATIFHVGYSRYFTPPPVENVSGATVAQFIGTSNQSPVTQDDAVRAERADYFDARGQPEAGPGLVAWGSTDITRAPTTSSMTAFSGRRLSSQPSTMRAARSMASS